LRHLNEEQARRALTKAVGLEREAAARRLAEIRRIIGRLEGPSSLDDLRRDRDQGSLDQGAARTRDRTDTALAAIRADPI
jgi:hypothetical protein